MADKRPASPDHVPTLTEVLLATNDAADAKLAEAFGSHSASETAEAAEAAEAADLLELIQQRIDMVFQTRLREAIAPALARLVDGLLRDLGPELARVLRDTAEQAVTQELARRRRDANAPSV